MSLYSLKVSWVKVQSESVSCSCCVVTALSCGSLSPCLYLLPITFELPQPDTVKVWHHLRPIRAAEQITCFYLFMIIHCTVHNENILLYDYITHCVVLSFNMELMQVFAPSAQKGTNRSKKQTWISLFWLWCRSSANLLLRFGWKQIQRYCSTSALRRSDKIRTPA